MNLQETNTKIAIFLNAMQRNDEKYNTILHQFKEFLLEKNTRYNNSAVEPINVFSNQNNTNSIAIRIDDKISRIIKAGILKKNDICDLFGYIVLFCITSDFKFTYTDIPTEYLNLNLMEMIAYIQKNKFGLRKKTLALAVILFDLLIEKNWSEFKSMLD
jgi:hypothetical protein